MSVVLFLSSDLMFSSRVLGAAKQLGVDLQLVTKPSDLPSRLTSDCRLLLIDLAQPQLEVSAAITALRQIAPAAQSVAFGSHVDTASLAAAKEAGCDVVLSRSQFQNQYAGLLRDFAAQGSS